MTDKDLDDIIDEATSNPDKKSDFHKLELYSWVLFTLSVSVLYGAVELGFLGPVFSKALPYKIVFSFGLILIGFNLISSIRQLLKSKSGNWKLPGMGGTVLLLILMFSYGLITGYSGYNPQAQKLNIALNSITIFPAIMTVFYLKKDSGLKSLLFLLIPVIVIGSSYAMVNIEVSAASFESNYTDTETKYLDIDSIGFNIEDRAAKYPPMNRMSISLGVYETVSDRPDLIDIAINQSVKETPASFCTKNLYDERNVSELSPDSELLQNSQLYLQEVKQSKDIIEHNLNKKCKESVDCETDIYNASKDVERFISVIERQHNSIEKVLRSKANFQDSTQCIGTDQKIKVKNLSCSTNPTLTLENPGGENIDGEISLGYPEGNPIWEEKEFVINTGEEKTLRFNSISGFGTSETEEIISQKSGEGRNNMEVLLLPEYKSKFKLACKN